jgi:hypothetical protein
MNNLKTTNIGGFPLQLDDFRFVNDSVLEAFRGIMSTYGIVDSVVVLSGCKKTTFGGTTTISSGYVSINGEICLVPSHSYPVITGGEVEYWTVDVSFDSEGLKEFQDGTMNNTYEVRIGKVVKGASVPVDHTPFSSSLDVFQVIADNISVVPSGVIVMWAGSVGAIPTGYRLCDGSSGAPDLRSRFIIGYDASNPSNDTIGQTGGNDSITLSTAQMPAHTHFADFYGNPLPGHTHKAGYVDSSGGTGSGYRVSDSNISAPNPSVGTLTDSVSAGTPSGSVEVQSAGNGDSINIRPRYYTLAFIQKI